MSGLLRDPLWQFIGVILALLAIGVSILIYLLQRNRKSLGYEIISNTPLLTMKEELEGKLQILYEGTSIRNAQLIVIKIINSGNVPIAASDYERPLQFVFDTGAKILSAEVTEKVPDNLLATITSRDNAIVLEPTLLNGKDSITVKALVSDYQKKPKADARIIGVKSVRPITDVQAGSLLIMLVGLALLVIGMVALIRAIGPANTPKDVPANKLILSLVLLLFGYVLSFIGMFRTKRYRKFLFSIRRGLRDMHDRE